jgi:hypothetical protein
MKQTVRNLVYLYLASRPGDWPSRAKIRHLANAWDRHVGSNTALTSSGIEQFRESCRSHGLSPATYESQISDLMVLGRDSELDVSAGKRDLVPPPEPEPAPLEDISAAYKHAPAWLRQWMAIAYHTCLRVQDSIELQRSRPEPGQILRWTASKTGRRHCWPIPAWLNRHLSMHVVLAAGSHRTHLQRVLRQALQDACDAAHVPYWTPQRLRQAGLTAWASVSLEAASIVHGCGMSGRSRVLRHYVDRLAILQRWMPQVRLPEIFASDEERAAADSLPSIAARLDPDALEIVRRTAERLAR